MGRRSLKTTKAGKFMNPTDQYRKEQRRKELKKNKKQRQIVREAVLRMKDVGQMLQEIEEIERQELENLGQTQHNEKGLEEKKGKLHASIHRVARYYQQEDPKKAQELKLLIMESEQRRREMALVYNSYRTASSQYAVEDIPMPDSMEGGLAYIPMPAAPSLSEEYHAYSHGAAALEPDMPPPPPPGSPPPDVVEYNVIETPAVKSVRFMDVGPDSPEPGPSDSTERLTEEDQEDEEEEEEEEEEEKDDKEEEIEEADKKEDSKEVAKDDKESRLGPLQPPAPPAGPSSVPTATAPPPPLFPQPFPPARFGFPPAPPPGPPPGFSGPPPRPLMPPQIPSGAILSAPPTRVQHDNSQGSSAGSGPSRSAIISAQPQLRNMTAEVTKFMPTSLRVRRDHPKAAKPKLKVNADQEAGRQPTSGRTQQTAGMHVQGDAYDTFMHEMQGLL